MCIVVICLSLSNLDFHFFLVFLFFLSLPGYIVLPGVRLAVCVYVCLSVFLCVCVCVCLSVCLSVCGTFLRRIGYFLASVVNSCKHFVNISSLSAQCWLVCCLYLLGAKWQVSMPDTLWVCFITIRRQKMMFCMSRRASAVHISTLAASSVNRDNATTPNKNRVTNVFPVGVPCLSC